MLKNFINNNGSKLVENAELVPYFALPYISDIKNHPFLKCIYT